MSNTHGSAVRDYFQEAAGYWEDIYRHTDVYALIHQERRELILRMIDELGLPAGARVLEVGCGAGHLAAQLAARGNCVTAVDAADSMVAVTRKRAHDAGVSQKLSVFKGEISRLAFPAAAFDLVLAVGVLPWVDHVAPAVAEMARVARPGGFLLVTMDNRWGIHRVLDPRLNPLVVPVKRKLAGVLASADMLAPKARARTLSVSAFDEYLCGAGLRKRKGVTLGFGPFTFWNRKLVGDQAGTSLHRRLQGRADRGSRLLRSLGAQYIVMTERWY